MKKVVNGRATFWAKGDIIEEVGQAGRTRKRGKCYLDGIPVGELLLYTADHYIGHGRRRQKYHNRGGH